MEFIIVTGMSGAGKSRLIDSLEDIGFYCVDNMPPQLLPKFAEILMQSETGFSRVAVVADVRGGQMFDDLFDGLDLLKKLGGDYKILFLDCADHIIKQRYKETRRQHPLQLGKVDDIDKAISLERDLLRPLRDKTNYLIDTTFLSSAQLKERVNDIFLTDARDSMKVICTSFGFKHGYATEADLVFDVRCFPNPYYEPNLRNKTGLDPEVRDYVRNEEKTIGFEKRLYDFIDYMLPLYREEGKTQLVVAIGCTGGKHRSVALTEALAEHIRESGTTVSVNHRDIGKK